MLGVGEGNEETRGMAKWAEVKHEDDDDEEETEAITEEECLFDQRISVRVCFYWLGGRSGRVKLSALYFLISLLQIVMLILHQASTCDPSTAKRNENRGNRKRHVFLLCFLLSNLIWLRVANRTEAGPSIVNND